jgi:hypothetical protein
MSKGPSHNAKLASLEEEMAMEYGVFRADYEDLAAFRTALRASGLTWPMVQAEFTSRSGKPSAVALRNAAYALIAAEEEEKGIPMRTKLKKAEGGTHRDRYIHNLRLALRAAKGPEPERPKAPEPVKAEPKAPEPVKPAEAKAEPKAPEPPKAEAKAAKAEAKAAKAEAKAEPKAEVKPKAHTEEDAEQARWEASCEEVVLNGTPLLRWKKSGEVFRRGGLRELGALVEYDEDLGEWVDVTDE